MRQRAWGLLDWPGNFIRRTMLVGVLTILFFPSPMPGDVMLGTLAAVVAVNGAVWLFGYRQPAEG